LRPPVVYFKTFCNTQFLHVFHIVLVLVTSSQKKTWIKIRFIDSFKFLGTSLEKLTSYLDKDKLKITRSEFFNLTEDFDLLTRKGIFPYENVGCVEKLEDICLLLCESFYSSLTDVTTLYPRVITRMP